MLYPIAIDIGDSDTSYGVIIPDIVGCFSAGDTLEEAIGNSREAVIGHLEVLVEMEETIPLPTSMRNHIDNPDYAGMIWALVDIDVSRYLGKSEKINVTLPSRLVAMIDNKVASDKDRYKSRSAYLASLAEQSLINL